MEPEQQLQQVPQLPPAVTGVIVVVYLAVIIISIVSLWRIFTKAGRPGWASIVPIYNLFVLSEISGKPAWWGLLLCVPCVNIIFLFILMIALAERFGKAAGFGIGLALLSPIFFPILAFGDAQYRGDTAA